MTVTGTPATASVVTAEEVRMFLRDYAVGKLPSGQGNLLLDDVQFSPEEVNFAIKMAVSSYNLITPTSNVTASSFPNEYLFLIGIARFLMMSESFLQLRNEIRAQDGDIGPTGIYEKASAYAQLAGALRAEWEAMVKQLKTQLNLEGCYSRLGSGVGTRYKI
jgi:hypothetical protein